jgi:hypothetical protein
MESGLSVTIMASVGHSLKKGCGELSMKGNV